MNNESLWGMSLSSPKTTTRETQRGSKACVSEVKEQLGERWRPECFMDLQGLYTSQFMQITCVTL